MEQNGQPVQKNEMLERIRNRSNGDQVQINERICPFMSNADKQCACTPQCQLYRSNKGEYVCQFQELQAVAWYLNPNRRF